MEKLKENVVVDLDQLAISQCITKSSNSVREYSNSIPIDLLIDLFSRVPPKSIGRFRCVSKFWASILRRPDFTELFLTKSSTRPRILLSFKFNEFTHKKEELFVFSAPQPQNLDKNSSVVATRYKSFPKHLPTKISSTLRGLVLLHRLHENTRVIWNPVTEESITLPSVKARGLKTSYVGFDPINKQFKVLCFDCPRRENDSWPKIHQVLTFETGKYLWRKIEAPIFPHIPLHGGRSVCIDGVLYYLGISSTIVCFNVRSEKFGLINKDKDMSNEILARLVNYKGKLSVLRHFDSWRQKELVLWVLEDAGIHKWSKTICVLPPSWFETVNYSYKIVGMTGTGDIVFSRYSLSNPFYLFYFNVERKTFTRIEIKGLGRSYPTPFDPTPSVSTFLVDYVENI